MQNFKYVLRTVAAFALGLAVAFAQIIGVELLSNTLYPLPSGAEGDYEQVCVHVANYPTWLLGVVVVAWGAIALIGTWIALRIGNAHASILLGLLLAAAAILNVTMLPYPIWFKVAILIAVPVASLWSYAYGQFFAS